MDKLTPEKLEVFITQTLLDFREGKISYEDCVVRFGEKFVEVYQLTLEEKSPTYVSDDAIGKYLDSMEQGLREANDEYIDVRYSEELIKDIENLRSLIFKEGQPKTNWISIKDRLPEEDEGVLVYAEKTTNKGSGYKEIAYYTNKCWLREDDTDIECNMDMYLVTHWQPIPKDPISEHKEEKK